MNLISLFLNVGFIYCMQVIPERAEITYLDTNYMKYIECQVKRYGRTSGYYINIKTYLTRPYANNVTIDIIFNEHLHNEYRRSFIEFHYKGCDDWMNNDIYIAAMLHNAGVKCPALPGEYLFQNLTVPSQDFPNVFPFRRGRVDITFTATDYQEKILEVRFYVTFKQDMKKKT